MTRVYFDSIKHRITNTVSTCFTVLRQLWNVRRRSVPRSVLPSLVTSVASETAGNGKASLADITLHLLKRLQ